MSEPILMQCAFGLPLLVLLWLCLAQFGPSLSPLRISEWLQPRHLSPFALPRQQCLMDSLPPSFSHFSHPSLLSQLPSSPLASFSPLPASSFLHPCMASSPVLGLSPPSLQQADLVLLVAPVDSLPHPALGLLRQTLHRGNLSCCTHAALSTLGSFHHQWSPPPPQCVPAVVCRHHNSCYTFRNHSMAIPCSP